MKKKFFESLLAFFALILLWYAGSKIADKPFLPDPFVSIKTFVIMLVQGKLNTHIFVSTVRVFAGTLAGLAAALPVGLCMGYYKKFDRIMGPFFYLLYSIPKIVFLPVIIVLLGLGNAPKIFLIALVLFFQLAIVIRDSAKNLPAEQVESMRSLNASRLQTFYHLVLPGCMPGIMTSLRTSLGTSVALLFIAETYASFSGLGYFIMNSMDRRDYEEMYAGIIALALLGSILYLIIEVLEHRICKWQFL